ncbi:MAG TPA: acyltransferase family protein [Candidatus Dormibacteraeota bacterium]|nr:acyltransferase family protein [Candidatus Dormibacteraeota bacterium]
MSEATTRAGPRVHYLDTLKAAVVYGILLYHAALPFTFSTWLISDPRKSLVLTGLTAFCFPWGIPMMFLLAGADSWFALRSRSAVAFLWARFLRLVLPLAVGIALLSPLQWYLTTVGVNRSLPSLLRSYPVYFRGMRLSWTPEWLARYGYHLWFLGYLFAISVALLPVLILLRRPESRRAIAGAAHFCRRPGAIYLFALPLIASQVALRARFPAYQDWADIATYVFVFLAGAVLASERGLEAAIRANGRLAVEVGLLSTGGVGILLLLATERPDNQALRDVMYAVLWSLMVWSWLLAVLDLGIRWLDFRNRVTAYLSESILPFYVIHHPLVVLAATTVTGLSLGVWPKFAAVAGFALATTLLIYELGVRRWTVTRLLFGLKPLPGGPSSRRSPGPAALSGTSRRPYGEVDQGGAVADEPDVLGPGGLDGEPDGGCVPQLRTVDTG